jgi:cytidine deaminase
MNLDQRLIDAAVDQVNRRWPAEEYGGAAAVYLEDGQILTSVGLDNINGGVTLCHETGAICQAYTLNKRVTASVCVGREAGSSETFVLAPCGICQERLALWGPEVQVGVADPSSPSGWTARTLLEVNPFYWGARYADGGPWPSPAAHAS